MAVNQPRDKAEEIVARVKYLPSLPAVVDKLLMMLDDMDTSAVEIERLVSTDSALASRILKLANSPLYKGVHSVATISQAVTRLGMWKLRDVAVTVSTTGTLAEMADQQIQNAYWHHALFTATCASVLAQETGVPVPEIPFTLGLLHDVGSLVLAAVAPEEYRGFQKLSSARQTEQEMQVFGTTHPRIGSLLLRQWNLPKSLWEGVRLHHNEQVITSNREPVISLVALADMLWRVNHAHAEPPVTARTLQTVARRVDLPLERVAHVLRRVDAEVDTARQDLEIAGDVSFLTSAPASRAPAHRRGLGPRSHRRLVAAVPGIPGSPGPDPGRFRGRPLRRRDGGDRSPDPANTGRERSGCPGGSRGRSGPAGLGRGSPRGGSGGGGRSAPGSFPGPGAADGHPRFPANHLAGPLPGFDQRPGVF